MTESEDLIKKLNLMSHPEGGHFSESFRDENNNVSLIYYLLQRDETLVLLSSMRSIAR